MAIREIPAGSVEVQTGLYWYQYTKVIAGNTYTFGELYSTEGYCFWEVNQPENYDEEGNLKPLEERVFAQYSTCVYQTVDEINANYVSVPAQEGYEIVSAPTQTETI